MVALKKALTGTINIVDQPVTFVIDNNVRYNTWILFSWKLCKTTKYIESGTAVIVMAVQELNIQELSKIRCSSPNYNGSSRT